MGQSELLWTRLASEARLDVSAETARYSRETGDDDPDRFLAWLHGQRKITDTLFAELASVGDVSVARFVGVKDKTLVLEPPTRTARTTRTMMLPANQPTLIADGTHPGSSPAPVPPRESRQYTLLGCLGKGAMGEVHVARDEDLLRKVAYKKMVPEVAGSSALAARFFSEIQVTAQLDHPNIVPIYGLEVTGDGALGYSMKLVQGKTLAQVLAATGKDALALDARLEIFLKVCDALAYAHSKGVLHRDLKPENIMVGRYNEVYVMDWGICRVIGSDDPAADKVELATAATAAPNDRTQFGAILGTPSYMSPEQASGLNADLDGRSDVYALGLILHEVVGLAQAVTGDTLEIVLGRATRGDKNPLVGATRELAGIVARATAFARNSRYESASELADDVRRYLRGQAPRAAPDNTLQKMARALARHRALALGGMLGLFVVAAAATIGVLLHEKNALSDARRHEEAVQAFATSVAAQAHAIDSHFLAKEALLLGLAGRAAELVAAPPAARNLGDTTVYLNQEYETGHGPPDLAPSPYYGRPISFGWATVKLPPGVDRPALADDVRLAGPLRTSMTNVLRGDIGGDSEAVRARFLAEGGPLLRVFVTLASGVHMSYPGLGGFAAAYDGRQRPKYRLAAGKKGVFWGSPYPDQFGHGLLLPMSTSLYDDDGKLLGVCGADTTFTFIKAKLLELAGSAATLDEYLVDDQGRVVVHRQDGAAAASAPALPEGEDGVALDPLPLPRVVDAIRAGSDGDVVAMGSQLVAYNRLKALGWTYVVVADERRLVSGR